MDTSHENRERVSHAHLPHVVVEAIALAAGLIAEGGSRNFRFSTRSSESDLHRCIRLVRGVHRPRDSFFLRAESYFNVATEIGFYVLDEPEAALSPARQLAFLARLHQLVRMGSQFIIATHSPILMAYPEARLLELGQDGIREVAYEDTEHFKVTRAFLTKRERMLHELLGEGGGDVD